MKGIILAGGKGTRLYPMTLAISKQMIPIYDKPMIYYPLSVLMLAGIKDILLISTKRDIPMYKELLGDGTQLGLNIEYKLQEKPNGIAESFILGESFIGDDSVCLILGDNFFYGHGFSDFLNKGMEIQNKKGAMILAYAVKNPSSFGIIEFNKEGKVVSLEEKPKEPKSNFAVPGLYFFDNSVVEKSKTVKKSARGEYEIVSVLNKYLEDGQLYCSHIGRGLAWLDTGDPNGLNDASNFVRTIQDSQSFYIACLEEIAYNNGFISYKQLQDMGNKYVSNYGKYILSIREKGKK